MNQRLHDLAAKAGKRKLDRVLIFDQANILALTGVNCDAGCLELAGLGKPARGRAGHVGGSPRVSFYTDFRYVPMVHRVAPKLKVGDLRRMMKRHPRRTERIGYESSVSHARYLALVKAFPGATFVDVTDDLKALRAVKTPGEQAKLRAAVDLNDEIWTAAQREFRAGMTEREMAQVIKHMMIECGDGEAFDTIVCVGKNAAECHHEPDDTVWNGREPILVDMGVKLDGFCSDMTRNLAPKPSRLYRQVYDLVLKANRAAIAAARPGITGKALDRVARDVIRKGGFGRCFGHSLGHGVGYEIHEAPTASKRDDTVLKPGMSVTIEPGVYLEDNLGVRIEDLVLITETGCEVLTHSAK